MSGIFIFVYRKAAYTENTYTWLPGAYSGRTEEALSGQETSGCQCLQKEKEVRAAPSLALRKGAPESVSNAHLRGKTMKIAMLGGAGFVGSHLTQAYLHAGHDVFVIDNLVHGAREAVDPRARFYHLDIRDGKLQAVLQAERPDIVSYHAVQRERTLPCEGSLIDADVHIRGLLNVLDGCVNAQVTKLIFASGGNSLYRRHALQSSASDLPVHEDVEVHPQRPQDISKIAGEWYVRYYTRQYRLPHLILRYADIYGEMDAVRAWHPLTALLAQLMYRRRPIIRGTDRNVRDHIFIDDVVRANLAALERGYNETLHISSARGYTLKQFYRAATRALQSDILPVYASLSPTEPDAMILDNRRASLVLGWQPEVDFLAGVDLAVERFCGSPVTVSGGPLTLERLELRELPARATALV
ncbi:MAG TPA: NAD-dependent epimerase/dehydratase family protein [Ktedonobacteraceae bacterium]|jgi:UDP-glucose 4-epimerase